jgi:hypothetical protein
VHDRAPQAADQLVGPLHERAGDRRADVLDVAAAVEEQDEVGRIVDQRRDPRGRAGLRLGGADRGERRGDRAVGQRRGAHRHPDRAAVGAREADLLVDAAAGAPHARGRRLFEGQRLAVCREQHAGVDRGARERTFGYADHPLCRLVGVQDATVRVPDDDAFFECRR